MAALTALTMASMPLFSYVGLSGMTRTASRNGLLAMLRDGNQHGDDTRGVFAVPVGVFRSMIRFFLPIVSLEHAGVSIQGARFLAIWTSIWVLMNVESMRGNRGSLSKKLLPISGLLAEFVGVGTVLPIWCLIHLWDQSTPSQTSMRDSIAHPDDVTAMVWSLLIGAGLPTLLMYSSSSGATHTILSKQFWIAVRLFHPMISALILRFLRRSTTPSQLSGPEASTSGRKLYRLNQIALWIAGFAHGLSMITTVIVAVRGARSGAKDQWPSILPAVVSPWHEWTDSIGSLEEGIGIFLFWDEAATSAAVILWAADRVYRSHA